jgi:uncharacterized protein YaaQ
MTYTPFNTGRMKLVVAIVVQRDLDELEYALRRRGHHAVVIDESGAVGRAGNATLMIGVQEQWLFDLMEIIEETCRARVRFVNPAALLADPPDFVSRPIEERQGGAAVFVLNLDRFERIA